MAGRAGRLDVLRVAEGEGPLDRLIEDRESETLLHREGSPACQHGAPVTRGAVLSGLSRVVATATVGDFGHGDRTVTLGADMTRRTLDVAMIRMTENGLPERVWRALPTMGGFLDGGSEMKIVGRW